MKIIAMGNELRKDDSIALDIAKEIGAIKVYSCPENFVKENEEVIIVDAVDFGKEPGNVKSFKTDEIKEYCLSTTHNAGISLLLKICRVKKIIGIQPKDVGYGKFLSKDLEMKKKEIILRVKELLHD